jgi:hypothetical protein
MARPTKKQRQIKEARELLANETLKEIFEERKQEIRDRWQSSTTRDEREACFFEITALEGLKDGIYAIGTDDDDR